MANTNKVRAHVWRCAAGTTGGAWRVVIIDGPSFVAPRDWTIAQLAADAALCYGDDTGRAIARSAMEAVSDHPPDVRERVCAGVEVWL